MRPSLPKAQFAIGAPVTMVEGESTNLKLTGPEDLAVAAALLGGVTR